MFARVLSIVLCGFCPASAWADSDTLNPTTDEVNAFVLADQNQDGLLNRDEFRIFVRAMAETGQPTARQIRMFRAYGLAFRITDKDDDGILTPAELRNADDDHRAGKGPYKPASD